MALSFINLFSKEYANNKHCKEILNMLISQEFLRLYGVLGA